MLQAGWHASVLPGEGLLCSDMELGARPRGQKESINMEEDAFQTHRTMWERLRVRMWVVWPVPGPSTQTAYAPGDTMAKKAGGEVSP